MCEIPVEYIPVAISNGHSEFVVNEEYTVVKMAECCLPSMLQIT